MSPCHRPSNKSVVHPNLGESVSTGLRRIVPFPTRYHLEFAPSILHLESNLCVGHHLGSLTFGLLNYKKCELRSLIYREQKLQREYESRKRWNIPICYWGYCHRISWQSSFAHSSYTPKLGCYIPRRHSRGSASLIVVSRNHEMVILLRSETSCPSMHIRLDLICKPVSWFFAFSISLLASQQEIF